MINEKLPLPEAPASATVKIKSKAGFEWLFTVRSETASDLLGKIITLEEYFTKSEMTPLAQGNGFQTGKKPVEYVQGRVCPKDGGKLVVGTGKIKEKCENYKYSMQQKQNIGSCSFILWD